LAREHSIERSLDSAEILGAANKGCSKPECLQAPRWTRCVERADKKIGVKRCGPTAQRKATERLEGESVPR
jgi:hypothetical protein